MVQFRSGWVPTPPSRPRVVLDAAIRPLAALPSSVDYGSAVPTVGMHLNDTWGCCVYAADANIVQQQTSYGQGTEVVVPDSEVLAGYETTGFNPNAGPSGGNPTDNGAQVADGLDYLKKRGMAGHTIAGYGQVSVGDRIRLQTAISEFGGLDIGLTLPNSGMRQFNSGQDWDVVVNDGGIDGGHCVLVVGYDDRGYQLWTWDRLITATYPFWDRYVQEAWAVVSHDWVNATSGKDPEGVDLVTLGAEFQAVTGQNPFPTPAPVPPPHRPPHHHHHRHRHWWDVFRSRG